MLGIFLLVGAGGALGAMARYGVAVWMVGRFGQAGWMATLAVNMAGCCLMGIFAALLASSVYISEPLKSFLFIGFLGGLTTFSSFALDGYGFWMRGDLIGAAGYIGASVILSLASFAIAYGVVRTALGAG